jgi:glycosyltransferase involved in cell wall biosynthesis
MTAVSEKKMEGATLTQNPAPMSERLTFINCSLESFEGPWLSHQQIMSRLARRHAVMYVARENTLDGARSILAGGKSLRSKTRFLAENVNEFRPTALLPRVFFSGALDALSTRLRGQSIRRAARRAGGERRSVLYFWNPHFVDLVGKVGESLSVFHMHDYHPGFAKEGTLEHAKVVDQFKKSLDRADLVVACSEALLHEARAHGRRDARLVENGVDFNTVAGGAAMKVPAELARLPRPIVGHIGRINRKLDMDAIGRIAAERPSWSVVLMGPRTGWPEEYERRFQALLALPNVHYVAGHGWDDLPAYFNAIDVGLMAYRTEGTWMAYGFPLKLWEYFSLGKAVVGSDVRSLRKFSSLLELVTAGEDWVAAVQRAIEQDSEEKRGERADLARRYDWDGRATLIEGLIGEALAAKSRG